MRSAIRTGREDRAVRARILEVDDGQQGDRLGHAGPGRDEAGLEDASVGTAADDDEVVGAGGPPDLLDDGVEDGVRRDRARQTRQDAGERGRLFAALSASSRATARAWTAAVASAAMPRSRTSQSRGPPAASRSRRAAMTTSARRVAARIHHDRLDAGIGWIGRSPDGKLGVGHLGESVWPPGCRGPPVRWYWLWRWTSAARLTARPGVARCARFAYAASDITARAHVLARAFGGAVIRADSRFREVGDQATWPSDAPSRAIRPSGPRRRLTW